MNSSKSIGRRAASAIIIALLTVLMMTSVSVPVRAEDEGSGDSQKSYSYRMKISAGNNGVMKLADGSEKAESIVYADENGAFPAVSTDSVKVTNSK